MNRALNRAVNHVPHEIVVAAGASEATGATPCTALLTAKLVGDARDLGGDRQRHRLHAVAVTMEEIPRFDPEPADFHGLPPVDEVRVGVAGGDAAGKQLKTQGFNLGEIADGTVGDAADAVQRRGNVGVNLTDKSAEPR